MMFAQELVLAGVGYVHPDDVLEVARFWEPCGLRDSTLPLSIGKVVDIVRRTLPFQK